MNAPQLTLKSVTGVDVELQIAGPGSRSYAFIIDWHIRGLFALLWFVAAALFFGRGAITAGIAGSGAFIFIAVVPTFIIYVFYHPVLELAMRGRTPGKRMAGVRVLTRHGEIPSSGAILLRNVFRVLDSLPLFYVVGLVCVIFTRQHVRIGDLAAGTLLVLDAAESEKSLPVPSRSGAGSGVLTPQAFDLVHELLERWSSLNDDERCNIARALLAKLDPQATPQGRASSSADLHERLRALMLGPSK